MYTAQDQRSDIIKGQASILVVDDDYDLRHGIATRLQATGYRVSTAKDGRSAIASIDEGGIDVVLLDINMPDIDGFAVCEMVRKTSDLPIIFLTGSDDPMIRNYLPQLSETTGGNFFLRKPCDPQVLLTLIDTALEGRI